ncbi:glycosyltransferase family A protein [Niabella drilacis]|uniref:Glycosyltransferase, GT2 family n=1 Tax=Niabella drilacis (strain DSM 25811 / CCM 8410 / CCUG 62505 / LMG 26954 / E90) TaxID=1285928 RepID=A0A1G6ZZU4_NIADE|nr:glycosyltransferase family 2 protein [Niabella drilacis]SDE07903.1 Glycosyltransferase, GT2 family [Niabella drilacis]
MMRPGISIILCTYNGALKLPETLGYLARQKTDQRLEWEIIFVDNNSHDHSTSIVEETWRQHKSPAPLFTYTETTPGKYYALQTAIARAHYDYFIICDDDTGFHPDYLSRAFELMNAHPEVGAAGGLSLLKLPDGIKAPEWLPEDYEPFALGRQADRTGYIPMVKGRLWGAGLVSRTDLYKKLYATIPSLLIELPDKKALISEDTEFCARLILKGYQLYYDEGLVLHHMLDHTKLTTTHRDNLRCIHDASGTVMERYRIVTKVRFKKIKWPYKLKVFFIVPFRMWYTSNTKSKTRYRKLLQYLYPGLYGRDIIIEQIQEFAET